MAIRVQENDFDISAEIAALTAGDTTAGAVASFIGKVRGTAGGQSLVSMTLEHYPGMTELELEKIDVEARERFKLSNSLIIHRIGTLLPGDNIVLVITVASHRGDALSACEFLMDYLKTLAPFWKKETRAGREGVWVDARDGDDKAVERWQSGKI